MELSGEITALNAEISAKETEFLSLLSQLAADDDTKDLIEATKRIFSGVM